VITIAFDGTRGVSELWGREGELGGASEFRWLSSTRIQQVLACLWSLSLFLFLSLVTLALESVVVAVLARVVARGIALVAQERQHLSERPLQCLIGAAAVRKHARRTSDGCELGGWGGV
jgi:hypothetical protein